MTEGGMKDVPCHSRKRPHNSTPPISCCKLIKTPFAAKGLLMIKQPFSP